MAKYVALVDIRGQIQNVQELASVWGDIRIEFEEFGVDLEGSYAVLGEYDYLLIFDAPDRDTAFKAGIAVESHGMDMQTMEIIPIDDFAQLVED
ncbi:GYD domain-containing protein [Haladaptatus salinisoli]|uniref:GYD domain-containing protein n=1 Tax=Haladaptatus salinisoli TaxID=2884876 RepID=UPI001D09D2A9|nr:GYD domain-containing protein [Haladaptatus salinisoli]